MREPKRRLLYEVQELDFETVLAVAAVLPVAECGRGITTEVLVKRYALRALPRQIVHRKKHGLSLPRSSWIRGPLYGWADARLRSKLLDEVGVNSLAAVSLLAEHRRGVADHARAPWAVIVVSEWLERAASRTRGHEAEGSSGYGSPAASEG